MTRSLLFVLLACAALAACGRAGAPSPPGPASQVIYPHQYPSE
jgi:predicted small lipoprotein YifL